MPSLQLTRPLAVIDLETTGTNVATDRIIEIAIVKVMPDKSIQKKTRRINPGMPIPPATTAIHGISDEDVKDCPTFKQAANELRQFMDNCDIAGYNSNRFDIPLLVEEFLRTGLEFDVKGRKFIDVQKIFHLMEKRTLSAAYKFYCDKNLENAHSAEADALATYEILEAQLDRYEQLQSEVDPLAEFTKEEEYVDFARRMIMQNGTEVFNFGKYKGRAVRDVLKIEPQYYDWMMKADFPLNTKQKLTDIYHSMMLKKI
ncbi:MAG: Exonuclease RNase and polymerase [Bacteroidetes bacterium]|uniref:3'-5' exonuclease n=1 Tax=unclassified Chitinophaga TaxID=2619133 RepID=UPI0009CA4B4A|nr:MULTISPECIES: 3'-5' exonuclease [unclassified Chitinophaga]MBP1652875.1 Exonuclease RNase and polymerase [Bacteroidota bacterium]OMP80730.1 DNA polymerase III subunit epsilon [[Flexibacter] sp. ATCC 35208]WPV70138.1 3'-5' exonuclease [Chitinophaga sp. LS1]